jgi:hypothetical protein
MPLSPVERAAQTAWKPQDIRLPWEWMEDNIEVDRTSPMPGMWRSANSPWVKPLTEVLINKTVGFCAVKCSAQSSKTQTILNCLLYTVDQDPGPSMYVMANKDDAQDFVRDRFEPSMQRCQPVRDQLLRETKLGFTFRTMPLYFVGAGSSGKLQGKPMKRLWLDEVRNYPPGAYETVLKRVTAFAKLAQVFVISTPGKVSDAVDRAFKRGDQRTFHFPCPQCGTMQQLRFEQLKAEHPETHLGVKWAEVPGARENGAWNFQILGKAIRYQCCNEMCKHLIPDLPTTRKAICRQGSFIPMNPKAEPCDVSFTWNALLPWWVSWAGIVKEFIEARAALKDGKIDPMFTFITETLAESWEDRLGVVEDYGFLEARKAPYDYGEKWAEETKRFMAADKQEKGGEHYWYVIRAFGANGSSRLITHARCNTYAELEKARKDNNVSPINAMIDSGYMAQDVYRFAGANRWKVFKGEDKPYFLVTVQHPRNPDQTATVRQLWCRTQAIVYNAQTKMRIGALPLFLFSNPSSNDLLAEYMAGLVGDFTLPSGAEKEYMRQVTGDVRKLRTDSKGQDFYEWHTVGDNHYRDCERMILAAAIISKTINVRLAVQAVRNVSAS